MSYPDAIGSLVDQTARLVKAEREVERLRQLCDRVITVHEQVVMDTPEDRALHDEACSVFRLALADRYKP